jgi:hypothetical protein
LAAKPKIPRGRWGADSQSQRSTGLLAIRETVDAPARMGAKVVAPGRYLVFQMAEVAVPRELFQAILNSVARLRQPNAAPCYAPE